MNDRQNRKPGSIGGENLTRLAVSTMLITLAACGGGGDGSDSDALDLSNLQSVPEIGAANSGDSVTMEAQTDVAEATAGTPLVVSILQNDSFTADARMQLVGQPANGTAVLLENGDVEYTADVGFEGTDSVDYVLVDAEGNQATGTLYIAVVCADCSSSTKPVDPSGLAYCLGSNPDPDGDGYGWEDNASCVMPSIGAALDPLAARADVIDIAAGEVKTVSPLRNDSIADRANVRFNIDAEPSIGQIVAAEAGILVYAAPVDFKGVDSMVYSITDKYGASSVASIDFNVSCATCADNKGLRLTWAANPESENVDGYRVLFGSDENPLTSSVISEVQAASLNGEAPNIIYDLQNDLNIAGGEGGCFMIKAYRGNEESDASPATCFVRS